MCGCLAMLDHATYTSVVRVGREVLSHLLVFLWVGQTSQAYVGNQWKANVEDNNFVQSRNTSDRVADLLR